MKNLKLWRIFLLVALVGVAACDENSTVPPAPGNGDLIINEFMASNDSFDVDGTGSFPDWIELYNPGSEDVNIGGWYMTDTIADDVADWFQIPAGSNETVVPAGGWLVLFANKSPGDGNLYLDFKLGSGGETIGLADADENVVDSLTYEQQTTDLSMGLTPDGTGQMVFLATPTPGAANSAGSGNLPASISDVLLDPISPVPDEAVTVSAQVSDDNGIASVILYYNVDGGTWNEVVMSTGGKVGGTYSASIPAQAVDAVVQYYILVTDSDTETTVFPEGAPDLAATYTPVYQLPFTLFINEFMASNDTTLAAPGEYAAPADAYVDWIEIYNPGDTPIDVGGMYITDDLSSSTEWQIPTTAADSTTIAAGGFLVLYADKDTGRGVLHTNIKLSGNGEDVGLFADDGQGHILLVDGYTYASATTDVSEGRETDGAATWVTFDSPTPGASNAGR